MISGWLIFFTMLAVLYIGVILGLIVRCENSCDFKEVKPYVWTVPILYIVAFFSILTECMKTKESALLKSFWTVGDTIGLLLSAMVDSLPDIYELQKVNAQRKQKLRQRRQVERIRRDSAHPLFCAIKRFVNQIQNSLCDNYQAM